MSNATVPKGTSLITCVRKAANRYVQCPSVAHTQHNTTQHNTAQHSTAQHSTAQHSTAQHNTTQHNTTHTTQTPHTHTPHTHTTHTHTTHTHTPHTPHTHTPHTHTTHTHTPHTHTHTHHTHPAMLRSSLFLSCISGGSTLPDLERYGGKPSSWCTSSLSFREGRKANPRPPFSPGWIPGSASSEAFACHLMATPSSAS